MDKQKKTEVITFRTEKGIKDYIEEIARLNQWSTAQVVSAIINNYAINPAPGEITIKAKELYEYVKNLEKDETIEAVQVSIFLYENDEGKYEKRLTIDVVECGGMGLGANDDCIIEMTQEEIDNIP